MFKRGLFAVVLLIAMVSVAHADAIITLTALTPENSVGGYLPATVVDFQVDISQDTASNIELRLVQLDFTTSDSALTFLGAGFDFDFSTLIVDALYAKFPSYPVPNLAYSGLSPIPGFMLEIPPAGGGMLTLGTGQLELPVNQGTYLLDALNSGTSNTNLGAQVIFGFGGSDPMTQWSSWNGLISGDSLALAVVPESVPEPSTLLLIGTGLVGLVGLRRKFRK